MNNDALVERYVSEDVVAPDRARLTDSGVPIWALIAYLQGANDHPAVVAAEYEITDEEMAAALAYYERHRAVFDARILLHHAAFAQPDSISATSHRALMTGIDVE